MPLRHCLVSRLFVLLFAASISGSVSAQSDTCESAHRCFPEFAVEVPATTTPNSTVWKSGTIAVTPGDVLRYEGQYSSDAVLEKIIQFDPPAAATVKALAGPTSKKDTKAKASTTFVVPDGVSAVSIEHRLVTPGKLAVGPHRLVPVADNKFVKGIVSITFDDGWKSAFVNAMPVLDAAVSPNYPKGLKTTHYVITGPSLLNPEKYANYMKMSQLTALHRNGHDIAAHTRTHVNLLEIAGDEKRLANELRGAAIDLAKAGFGRPASIAYPYGKHDGHIKVAAAKTYQAARTVSRGLNYADSDRFALRTQLIQRHTTVEEIKGWIDDAIDHRGWLILSLHQVAPTLAECVHAGSNEPDEECTDVATLRAMADYLKETPEGTVLTVREVLEDLADSKGKVWPLTEDTGTALLDE